MTFCVLLGFLHGAMALELGCFPQRDSIDQQQTNMASTHINETASRSLKPVVV